MKFIGIDLGASGTRYITEDGKIGLLPNNVAFIEDIEGRTDLQPYDSSVEQALEVTIKKDGDSPLFPAKLLMGTMAERYTSVNERPSVSNHKYKQRINYVSAIVAAAVARLKYELPAELELKIAVPPVEIRQASKNFKEYLVGNYVVELPKYMGGATVKLNIKDVSCYEESFMAMVSYFFNLDGTVREDGKDFLTGNVLSLDIGASSTDLSVIKNGRYLDKSGQTYKTGGNVARDFVIDRIREEYGFDLPINDAEKVMAEGRLQMGNGYVDIGNIVAEGKKALASSIVSSMQSYFKKIDMPIQTMRAIVVSGGGSLQSQHIDDDNKIHKTSEPMSFYVTSELQKICPGVLVNPYGDEARLANIKGLFIRAKTEQMG